MIRLLPRRSPVVTSEVDRSSRASPPVQEAGSNRTCSRPNGVVRVTHQLSLARPPSSALTRRPNSRTTPPPESPELRTWCRAPDPSVAPIGSESATVSPMPSLTRQDAGSPDRMRALSALPEWPVLAAAAGGRSPSSVKQKTWSQTPPRVILRLVGSSTAAPHSSSPAQNGLSRRFRCIIGRSLWWEWV